MINPMFAGVSSRTRKRISEGDNPYDGPPEGRKSFKKGKTMKNS
jgi:hypothetical protein